VSLSVEEGLAADFFLGLVLARPPLMGLAVRSPLTIIGDRVIM